MTNTANLDQARPAWGGRDRTDPHVWDQWAIGLDPMDPRSILRPPANRPPHVTVLAPHPDDETFGCGGLIALLREQGTTVTIVTVTDGAASHPSASHLARLRRDEQRAATRALGCTASPVWLGFRDGAATLLEDDLCRALDVLGGPCDALVAPWPQDGHPDHAAVGRVASWYGAARSVPVLLYPVWAWRWATPSTFELFDFVRVDLPDAVHDAKRRAMDCFASQTTDQLGEVIVDEAMVTRFSKPFEVFARA